MRYSATLLAVRDMPRALAFYKALFDQDVVCDLGWNKTLTCGLVLQEHFDRIADFPESSMVFKPHTMELYFETEDMDAFMAILGSHPEVERLDELRTYPWHQRGIRIYDPDGHLIEVSESMESVAHREFDNGLSVEETAEAVQHPAEVVAKWHESWLKKPRPIRQKACLRTRHLTLAPMSDADTDALVSLFRDREVTRFYMVRDYETDAEYTTLAGRMIALSQTENTKALVYGIYLNGILIGVVNSCGATRNEIEIGYALLPAYHNQGYMTEAFAAVLSDCGSMGFQKASAGHFAENTASRRVMEKCGLAPNGKEEAVEYRGETHTCIYLEKQL